jgi:hypothetical protein
MFRHSVGILTVFAVTSISAGCSAMAGVASDAIASRQPRGPVSDPLRRDGSDPASSVFGAKRLPKDIPTNLPLPTKANPANLFKIESPGPRTIKSAMAIGGGVVLFICAADEIWNTFADDCDQKPRHELNRPTGPKPIINR